MPRDDLVEETIPSTDEQKTTFTQHEGPFASYERQVSVSDGTVAESIRYRIVIPWFGWLFAVPARRGRFQRDGRTVCAWAFRGYREVGKPKFIGQSSSIFGGATRAA